ncbi:hypothetical protein HELRODRAFT_193947 [Helobdella robusta]|uniref:Nucleolar protein 14 n=1 Tax=Helobdella robusta TaxID=6412 RepID=T1FVI4_HELRO|nr:hypothetical protein HELRODRAFT_193947 [Helobdella robusta]ESN93746.1 hypothetical protein HELRODRAFT_193947 [Helobdella robusta]
MTLLDLTQLLDLFLVAQLYPTSDYHHHVVTPTMLFMSQLLSQYVRLSKRFMPEAVQFLKTVLIMHTDLNTEDKQKSSLLRVEDFNLLKSKPIETFNPSPFNLSHLMAADSRAFLQSDDFKMTTLWYTLVLLRKFTKLYADLPSVTQIFQPIRTHLQSVTNELMHTECIKKLASELTNDLESFKKPWQPLVRPLTRPQPIKQFEPRVAEKFDGRKKIVGHKDFQARKREQIKYKKLMKGSEKEIRKDQSFLSEHIFQEKIRLNKEREDKTKKILNSLAQQEGDFKSMLKRKRKADTTAAAGPDKKGKVVKF